MKEGTELLILAVVLPILVSALALLGGAALPHLV